MIVKSLLQTCSSAWFALPWWMITVLFDHRLPALSIIAVRSEIAAHQLMCHLAGFDNQIDDLLSLRLVNRHFERLSARRSPEKGDGQSAAHVCLRFPVRSVTCILPLSITIPVIIRHQGNSVGKSLRFSLFPQ